MLDVCLLGSGGMMPLPYRYLTALMTRFKREQSPDRLRRGDTGRGERKRMEF